MISSQHVPTQTVIIIIITTPINNRVIDTQRSLFVLIALNILKNLKLIDGSEVALFVHVRFTSSRVWRFVHCLLFSHYDIIIIVVYINDRVGYKKKKKKRLEINRLYDRVPPPPHHVEP